MYEQPVDWQGVLVPAFLSDELVAHGHRVADAAKAGDWDTLLRLLRSGDEQLWIKDRAAASHERHSYEQARDSLSLGAVKN